MSTATVTVALSPQPITVSYDELIVNGQWNQALLASWRVGGNHPMLICHCHPLGAIAMHIVERPRGSGRYHLADNPDGSPLEHMLACPRYHVDDPDGPRNTKSVGTPGVEWTNEGSANERVDIRINLFPQAPEQSTENAVNEEQPVWVSVLKNPQTGAPAGVSVSRAESEFGGLLREWYRIGFSHARRSLSKCPTDEQVLRGMWRSMLDRRVTVNKAPIVTDAYVPYGRITRLREGERKILLGRIDEVPFREQVVGGGKDGVQWRYELVGIDCAWTLVVPNRFRPKHHSMNGRFCLVDAEYHKDEWRALRRPACAIVHPQGGVWLDSQYEARMYEFLIGQGATVEKPLLPSAQWFHYKPDFVLPNESPPVLIEVWGLPDTFLTYHEQKAKKTATYAYGQKQGKIRFLEWNAQDPTDWARFVRSFRSVKQGNGQEYRYRIKKREETATPSEGQIVGLLDPYATKWLLYALQERFDAEFSSDDGPWLTADELKELLTTTYGFRDATQSGDARDVVELDLYAAWEECDLFDAQLFDRRALDRARELLGRIARRHRESSKGNRPQNETQLDL